MTMTRRQVLDGGAQGGLLMLLAGAGLLPPGLARAADRNQAAFAATSLADALALLDATEATSADGLSLVAPEIAENGALVPLSISSSISNTQQIAVLVEKNPNALAACFEIMPGTEASIATRVKMGQTSNLVALVKADGKFYTASREVKVTLGGCGG